MASAATGNPMMTHASELAPTGEHDTHIYDPNANPDDHRIAAVFETDARARFVRDQLIAAGIAADSIEILDPAGHAAAPDGGIWSAMKRFLLPDEDRTDYAETLRRGHPVLMVQPGPAHHLKAVEVLDAAEPIDFDARLEEWRAAGWTGLGVQQEQAVGVTTGEPGMPPATLAASTASTGAAGRQTTIVETQPVPTNSGAAAEACRVPQSAGSRLRTYRIPAP